MTSASARTEREVLLAHVQSLVLCLRSAQSFAPRTSRFSASSPNSAANNGATAEPPFLAQALHLQNLLLARRPIVGEAPQTKSAVPASTPSLNAGTTSRLCAGPDFLSASTSAEDLCEDDVLDVFCQVCTSPETTETMTNVALAGLLAVVELPCSFLSASGLCKVSAAAAGSKSEVTDKCAHEVLLAKVADLFVTCAKHPAAVVLPESWLCGMMSFLLAISVDRQVSPLLRRVAEKGVYDLVQIVFERVVSTLAYTSDGDKASPSQGSVPATQSSRYGCLTLGLVSALIAGDVVAFDHTGEALLADGRRAIESLLPSHHPHEDAEAAGTSEAQPAVAASSPISSTLSTSRATSVTPEPPSRTLKEGLPPKSTLTVFERNVHTSGGVSARGRGGGVGAADVVALQLEGLHMTQRALTVLGDRLDDCESSSTDGAAAAGLIDAVQHGVSRALLIAGVSTTQVVVLSQILRTVHMTVRCASRHLVPQVLSFLRVLHLNQLTSLAEAIRAAEAGLPISTVRLASSPVFSGPPGPTSLSFGSGSALLSTAQINDLHERRVVILESLAEFCADPQFGYYCYVHYDLSWQYAPILRDLCDTLSHSAAITTDDTRNSDDDPRRGSKMYTAAGNERVGATPTGLRPGQAVAVNASARLIRGLASHPTDVSGPASNPAGDVKDMPINNQSSGDAWRAVLTHARSQKDLLQSFATLFAKAPLKEAIPFLLSNSIRAERGHEYEVMREKKTWLVVAEPAGGREIGECLFRLGVVLSKRVLGDYIGELGRELHTIQDADGEDADEEAVAAALARSKPDDPEALIPGTVLFFHHQLLGYMQQFDFKGKSLLRSIREMVFQLSLPGESQKIDRVMEAFARHWFVQNENSEADKGSDDTVNPFHTENGAFVLSFAIIMLNTDLHSGKLARNMAVSDFKAMNRGIDDKRDVPDAYLSRIYDDVREHEIIMADMIDRGFANDVTWDLQMRGHSGLAHMPDAPPVVMSALHCEPRLSVASSQHSAAVACALNVPILAVIHRPCLLILASSLETCGERLDLQAPIHDPTVCGALAELSNAHARDVATFTQALRGVVSLIEAATWSRQPALADEAFLALLPSIDVIPSGRPEANMEDLFLSLCRLLRIRAALTILPAAGGSLHDAWPTLAKLLIRLQYFGLFAWNSTEDGALADAFDVAHDAVDVPEGLCRNPGWMKTVQERRLEREAKRKRGPGTEAPSTGNGNSSGGWLASLWSGGGGDKSEPDALERALMEAEPRVRECIPRIGELLDLLSQIPVAGRRALSAALAETCSAAAVTRDPVSDLMEHSIRFQLLCAVVEPYRAVPSPSSATPRAHVHGDDQYREREPRDANDGMYDEDYASVLSTSQRLIAISLEMIKMQRDPAFRTGVESLARVTAAVMGVVQRRLVLCARLGITMGSCASPGLIPTALRLSSPAWPLLQSLLPPAIPVSEYAVLVCPLVVNSLEQGYWSVRRVYTPTATAQSAQVGEKAASVMPPMVNSALHLFLPSLTAIILTMAPAVTRLAQVQTIYNLMSDIVRHHHYDVMNQSETLVVALVSLKLLIEERLASAPGRLEDGAPSVDLSALSRGIADLVARTARYLQGYRASLPIANNPADGGALENDLRDGARGDGDIDATGARAQTMWLMTLKALCLLLACPGTPRDAVETVLALQRSVLDTEARGVPTPLLVRVYYEVLLPLVEHVCAHGSSLVARPKEESGNEQPAASNTPEAWRLVWATSATTSRAFETRRAIVGNVFSLGAQINPTTAASPSATTLRLWETCAASVEVKCRLVNVLPKLLLQEAATLAATSPQTLYDVWQRVLGTLYAFCDTPKAIAASAELSPLMEAIEETVKNMVFVAASVLRTDTLSPSFDFAAFWRFTHQLISPFRFSAPIISYMASLAEPTSDGAHATPPPLTASPSEQTSRTGTAHTEEPHAMCVLDVPNGGSSEQTDGVARSPPPPGASRSPDNIYVRDEDDHTTLV